MINRISSESPYYILMLSLVHAMIYSRSRRIKYLPSYSSFFCKFLLCCVISVLVKYPFEGERPDRQDYTLPLGWKKILSLSEVKGFKRALAVPSNSHSSLLVQPVLEVYDIPTTLKQIKNRYFPRSGTPSSHSVIGGYLSGRLVKIGYYKTGLLPLIIPIGRVLYRHHYTYQVIIGYAIGYIISRVRGIGY